MKASVTRIGLGLAIFSGGLALNGCSTLDADAGATGSHPIPRTHPGEHTEVAYVRQKGKWHMLRIDLLAEGPGLNSDGDAYFMHLRSKASVWQFNRKTGDYDIRLSDSGSPSASQGLSFRFGSRPKMNRLYMMPANSGSGGGGAGWPDGNFTEVELKVDPTPGTTGVDTDTELEFSATATVTVRPNQRERKQGAPPLLASVERRWRVKVLPGQKAAFTELTD